MGNIRKWHSTLFTLVLFLSVSCYGSTAGFIKIASTNNVEWVISDKPFYQTGSYYFKITLAASKYNIPATGLDFSSYKFLKRQATLIRTSQKVQSSIREGINKQIHTHILSLSRRHKSKDYYFTLIG
ncbi:hypothetical protein [Muriicola sp. Z0-33]|uniref:hypothetical protein n=1 Tax=Muriicola sp. Z0-33 TaxID=2816957 RepID=UPI00223852BC|nr:hypothetical protein [Muriicola sp. Z0-33]MCW5515092.1 hypothetical protein [Muriicola sp. Z0-33]